MTVILRDRVKQYTSTAGSGDLSFTTTPNGYVSFSSVFNSGDLTYYCIENGSAWEVGIGRYLQNSLSRETILSSSSGSKLNLTGKSVVFVTLPASGIVRFDELGESNLSLSQLSNVLSSALNSGDILTYNGSVWENKPSLPSYSDEQSQDAVGGILSNTTSINLSYDDNTPSISATVNSSGITNSMLSTGIDASKIGSGLVSNIEFGYLDGVTSSIQSQLNLKADSGHLHTSADITDFSESVDDRVSSLLSAGTGIQLTYNDSGNSLSIDAYGILPTGGSAGQILSKIDGLNYNTEWIDNYAKEIVQYVKNSTGSTLYKGQVVYINGSDGTNPTISLSIASGESGSSKTIGFLKQDLNQGDFGYIITEGFLDGLNTDSATSAGDTMWLSPTTSGGVVYGLANKPYAPNHLVFLGYVIRKNINNGRIYVKIQNGFELDELHNVSATGAINGDILIYNSGNRLWESKPFPTLYNDENAQDAVGGILANTSSVSLSYDDNTPSISASILDSGITNSMLFGSIDATKIGSGSVDNTEFSYLDGVNSGIQPQLDLKVPTSRTITINGTSLDLSQDRSYTIPSGVTNLNGLTSTSQTFVVSSGGTNFAIQSSGEVHTFQLPDASATARGIVSTGVQTIAGDKSFTGILRWTGPFGQYVRLPNGNQNAAAIQLADNGGAPNSVFGPYYNTQNGVGWVFTKSSSGLLKISEFGVNLGNGILSWGNPFDGAGTTRMVRDAEYEIGVRNGVNSHIFRVYNTHTDASNYERSSLRFATYNTARYAVLAAESAGTGAANINLVLSPKGNGAFMLQVPDGTTTGGNARGANAIDLQTSRTAATQVAAGTADFQAGANNTTNAGYSATFGQYNSNTGQYGFVCGSNNTLSGQYGGIFGGFYNIANQIGAVVVGGVEASAYRRCMRAFAANTFIGAGMGGSQGAELVLSGITTTDTSVELMISQNTRLSIPSGRICHYILIITGVRQGGSDVAYYMRRVVIKNIGGTVSLVGSVDTIGTDVDAGTSLSVTADNTNKSLNVSATGVLSQNWRWNCIVYGGEILHQ